MSTPANSVARSRPDRQPKRAGAPEPFIASRKVSQKDGSRCNAFRGLDDSPLLRFLLDLPAQNGGESADLYFQHGIRGRSDAIQAGPGVTARTYSATIRVPPLSGWRRNVIAPCTASAWGGPRAPLMRSSLPLSACRPAYAPHRPDSCPHHRCAKAMFRRSILLGVDRCSDSRRHRNDCARRPTTKRGRQEHPRSFQEDQAPPRHSATRCPCSKVRQPAPARAAMTRRLPPR